MALLTRKTQIAVKAETTPGTVHGTPPAAADANYNIFEATFSPEVEQFERNPFRSSVGRRTSIAGVRTGTISFTTELIGSGSTGTAPSIGKLLAPCGFKEHVIDKVEYGTSPTKTFAIGDTASQSNGASGTVVAVTDTAIYLKDVTGTASATAAYTATGGATTGSNPDTTGDAGFAYVTRTAPSTYSSTDVPTVTVEMYNDGIRHRLVGARGNATFRVATGQPVQVSFEFTGPKAATADAAMLSGITYPSPSSPPSMLDASFKVQDFAGVIDNLEVSTGNELSVRRSANSATGLISTELVSRAMTGSIDPEATKISGGHDWFGKMESNTTGSLECTISGGAGAAGNQFVLVGPNTQYSGISATDRSGISVNQIDLAFNESATVDDDFVILAL